jgi:hypothetical protein
MTTPKRPRCRRCGKTGDGLSWECSDANDAVCLDAYKCGERAGAKRERERIRAGVEGLTEFGREFAPMLDRDAVLAVVARKGGRRG